MRRLGARSHAAGLIALVVLLAQQHDQRLGAIERHRFYFAGRERDDLTDFDIIKSFERHHSDQSHADEFEAGHRRIESEIHSPRTSQPIELLSFAGELAGEFLQQRHRRDDALVDQMPVDVHIRVKLSCCV